MQGVIAVYPEHTEKREKIGCCGGSRHFLKPELKKEELYQTVPVSRAAETDKALSMLEVKMADTSP